MYFDQTLNLVIEDFYDGSKKLFVEHGVSGFRSVIADYYHSLCLSSARANRNWNKRVYKLCCSILHLVWHLRNNSLRESRSCLSKRRFTATVKYILGTHLFKFITTGIATALYIIFICLTGQYALFYIIQGLLLLASAIDVSWFFQGLEEFRITVVRNTFVKVISLILIFTLIKSKADLWLYILILSGSQFIGNITLIPYLSKYVSKPVLRDMEIWKHMKPTLVMFIPQIASQIYLQLNKTMLGLYIGVQAAGFYDNSDKIIKILLAIVTATGTVLLPHMAHSFARGDRQAVVSSLDKSMHFILLLAFPMAAGLIAVSPVFTSVFLDQSLTQLLCF